MLSQPQVIKEYGSSWIFEPCLTWANALRRVQHPGFSLVNALRRAPSLTDTALIVAASCTTEPVLYPHVRVPPCYLSIPEALPCQAAHPEPRGRRRLPDVAVVRHDSVHS